MKKTISAKQNLADLWLNSVEHIKSLAEASRNDESVWLKNAGRLKPGSAQEFHQMSHLT